MLRSSGAPAIRLRGVRHNNLKNFDLDLPLKQLVVITGLSGSGKSSLAFDTLFAEGQRRYIETFSPYARQFFDRMDKPQVDRIDGIPPAIALEQRNSVRTTRSTVGTMTEICDYMKVIWPYAAQLHCRGCGQPVTREAPEEIWKRIIERTGADRPEVLVTFEVSSSDKLTSAEMLALISRQGYQRLLAGAEVLRLDTDGGKAEEHVAKAQRVVVVQDRVRVLAANRARFVEACEQAYHFGKGRLGIRLVTETGISADVLRFSRELHCALCDIEYQQPSSALFSFNHPLGACPACKGFGRVIGIDYQLALPDRSRTLRQGVVKPWLTGQSAECQTDLMRMCRHMEIPVDIPFRDLDPKWQQFVIDGDPEYGSDEDHEWPRVWYGVKGYFKWLDSKAYKMHVRVLLSRYRTYTPCPSCHGQRLQPEALLYTANLGVGIGNRARGQRATLADFYRLPVCQAVDIADRLAQQDNIRKAKPLCMAVEEVRARLRYLNDVGLGYLSLDRPTRSLSGGETQRVNLTSCLGAKLVNTLFVLDEPSVGLHPRDTERLVSVLRQLQQAGNSVVVVEHEPGIMRAADQIIDLGPGHGASGGRVVFQGSYEEILRDGASLTGAFLSGREAVEIPIRRPVLPGSAIEAGGLETSRLHAMQLGEAVRPFGLVPPAQPQKSSVLTIRHADKHNLKQLTVAIPLRRLVCVTGVSGSGKSTLVRDVLFPALCERLKAGSPAVKAPERMDQDTTDAENEDPCSTARPTEAELLGWESLGQVLLVEQSVLGKTPRSNPAVYIGAFDHIRSFYAGTEVARQRGLGESAFSFNSAQGQCERCRGAGYEKIEMQFLSDVFIKCPDCGGKRYRASIREVTVVPPGPGEVSGMSVADLLDATVDEAVDFLRLFPKSQPAQRASAILSLLQDVGLGYLRTGQPINTLSGGESQRLKLVKHLAEASTSDESTPEDSRRTIFLFDEPTTGLHFQDVAVLLRVFQRMVDAGHSVLVIEHNLDVIKTADWVIDLGPESGEEGGQIVAEGPPEAIAESPQSHTGRALKTVLGTVGRSARTTLSTRRLLGKRA